MAPPKMTSATLWAALTRLGSTLREPASLTLGGSAALLLTGMLDRLTDDGDVVESSVDFGRLLDAVRAVEVAEQTPSGWLNTSIQAYTHVLPDDFRTRLVRLPPLQRLDVSVLSRSDVILMKVYTHRPRDLQDLLAVTPSPEELAFVEQSLPRIGAREPEAVTEMQRTLTDLRAALATRGSDPTRSALPVPPPEVPPPGPIGPPRPRGRGR